MSFPDDTPVFHSKYLNLLDEEEKKEYFLKVAIKQMRKDASRKTIQPKKKIVLIRPSCVECGRTLDYQSPYQYCDKYKCDNLKF